MKSEYAQWKDEIERPRLSVKERVAAWFDRPAPPPPPRDPFAWLAVADIAPIEGEPS